MTMMQDEGERERYDTAMSDVDCLSSVCVRGIYLSDGGGYIGSGLLNRKAERAEFTLNRPADREDLISVEELR
jgi:hypothetical protein